MNFEEFLTEAQVLGRKLKRSKKPDEMTYLKTLAEMITHVKSVPRVKMENQSDGWLWTLLDYKAPVGSVRMKLKKHGALPVHDHRGYISLLYVVSGEVKISHFSSKNISAKRKSFELIETNEEILTKGEFSFATTESNIHSVQDRGPGSVLLDISTFLTGRGESYGIDIEALPNTKKRAYQGTWSGIKL